MHLLIVDMQERLVPALSNGPAAVAAAVKLTRAAALLGHATLFTEQNPARLGATLPDLAPAAEQVVAKMTFDASAEALRRLPDDEEAILVCGCEAHICVMQTALGLVAASRTVAVAADAVGSRDDANRQLALQRMARHGVDIVSAEMAIFAWIGGADHPAFREIQRLVK